MDPDDIPRMKPYERKTTEQSDAVKAAKQDFIERAKTHLGQLFDSPIASGTSGNSGKCLSFNKSYPVFDILQVDYHDNSETYYLLEAEELNLKIKSINIYYISNHSKKELCIVSLYDTSYTSILFKL